MNYLLEKNIETRPFFAPFHTLPMYKQKGKFNNSNFISENGLSLPSSTNLTDKQIEYICKEIKKFIKIYG